MRCKTYFSEFKKFGLGLHKEMLPAMKGTLRNILIFFWNSAASCLFLVFPEYRGVHTGIRCFIYNGASSCRSALQNQDKEMGLPKSAERTDYPDNHLGIDNIVFCYFHPTGDHTVKVFIDNRQRENCSDYRGAYK